MWRNEFVFFREIKAIIHGNVIAGSFYVFAQAKTVRDDADRPWQYGTTNIDRETLVRGNYPLITEDNIFVDPEHQSAR